MFDLFHSLALLFHILEVFNEFNEQIGGRDDCRGHSVEEIKKNLILRDYPLFDAHNDRYRFFRQGLYSVRLWHLHGMTGENEMD